jgi:hypothetical protein
VFASALDEHGLPSVSLRSSECASAADELSCVTLKDAALFARDLPAGSYLLGVSATAPTRVDLLVELRAPSHAPMGERCDVPLPLRADAPLDLQLDDFADDSNIGCLPGARDAVLELSLEQRSDVMIVGRLSAGDRAAVALGQAGCSESELLSCSAGDLSPLRVRHHDLPPGDYRVVVESRGGTPVQLRALVRAASVPQLVPGARDCESVFDIPPQGGFFQGNTQTSTPDFSAGCDVGVGPLNGASDQLLRFTLESEQRVTLDLQGSAYDTLLNLRSGAECPGEELVSACIVGLDAGRSYIDRVLQPGTYFVQIDGFNGAEGQWFLEAYFSESK